MIEAIDLDHNLPLVVATIAWYLLLLLLDYAQLDELSEQHFPIIFCGNTSRSICGVALSDPPPQQSLWPEVVAY